MFYIVRYSCFSLVMLLLAGCSALPVAQNLIKSKFPDHTQVVANSSVNPSVKIEDASRIVPPEPVPLSIDISQMKPDDLREDHLPVNKKVEEVAYKSAVEPLKVKPLVVVKKPVVKKPVVKKPVVKKPVVKKPVVKKPVVKKPVVKKLLSKTRIARKVPVKRRVLKRNPRTVVKPPAVAAKSLAVQSIVKKAPDKAAVTKPLINKNPVKKVVVTKPLVKTQQVNQVAAKSVVEKAPVKKVVKKPEVKKAPIKKVVSKSSVKKSKIKPKRPKRTNYNTVSRGKAPKARKKSTESKSQYNTASKALLNSSSKMLKSGQYRIAAKHAERALRVSPRNPNAYYQLALIYKKKSNCARASQFAAKGLSQNGVSSELRSKLLSIRSRCK
ncbi:MAG: hypothetical protein AAGF06_01510 [Pseudomonadota bacterium]